MFRRQLWSVAIVLLSLTWSAPGQDTKPDPVVRDILLANWADTGEKVVAMAEDFPEEKYDFRPVPGVRTFAEQLRHIAFWNLWVVKTYKGEKIDGKINELSKSEYPSKASVVAILKSTLNDANALLKSGPAASSAKTVRLFDTFTEHTGEHYGQLVVYYRLNGLVPPESRPKK